MPPLLVKMMVACALAIVHGHVVQTNQCRDMNGDEVWADGVKKPPAEYDHRPEVPYWLETINRDTMTKVCGFYDDACTFPPDQGHPYCMTFVQKSYDDGSLPRHILRHERAHCNGWTHPN